MYHLYIHSGKKKHYIYFEKNYIENNFEFTLVIFFSSLFYFICLSFNNSKLHKVL